MSFQANYPGDCQECGHRFKVGELIDRHIDGYQHADCKTAVKREYTRGDACTKCLLVHAGECF